MDKKLGLQILIYARAQDMMHLLDLKKAGAAILENAEVSISISILSKELRIIDP